MKTAILQEKTDLAIDECAFHTKVPLPPLQIDMKQERPLVLIVCLKNKH